MMNNGFHSCCSLLSGEKFPQHSVRERAIQQIVFRRPVSESHSRNQSPSCCFSAALPDSTLAFTSFQFPFASTFSAHKAPASASTEKAQKTAVLESVQLTTLRISPADGGSKIARL